jgi:hypothetical protein
MTAMAGIYSEPPQHDHDIRALPSQVSQASGAV